jgi:hypothetical protein
VGKVTTLTIGDDELPPGFVKNQGRRVAQGRWIDGDKVRFVRKKAQKIGGNERLHANPFRGICRGLHAWQDLNSHPWLGVGTTHKLYAAAPAAIDPDREEAGDFQNVTPWRPSTPTADLTGAFSTTSASAIVTVHFPRHNLKVEQGFEFTVAATVGGLAMLGQWEVLAIIDGDTFTFRHTSPASSTVATTGTTTIYVEIPPGLANAQMALGYGIGGYGEGTYGTARTESSVWFDPYYWSLDNFGQVMIASPSGGRIYAWDPATHPRVRAEEVQGDAPVSNRFVFVTQERFVIALGSNPDASSPQDPLVMRWSSQADYNLWTPAEDNTAGIRRLTAGKRLMGGGSISSGVSLVWSDTALYTVSYTGSRFVFDTRLAGTSCGLMGPMGFCFAKGRAFWVGQGAFHGYGGSVDKIPNQDDIADWLFGQLRDRFEIKTVCFYNELFDEVWWIFVPIGSDDPAVYAAVNLGDYSWVTGTMDRTSALRNDVATADTRPILAVNSSGNGFLHAHEHGHDDNGAAMRAYIQSGPVPSKDTTQVTGVMPDFGYQQGNVTILVTSTDRADSTEIDRAQIVLRPGTGLEDMRLYGRLISMRLTSNAVGGDFRLGNFQFETMTGGRRR